MRSTWCSCSRVSRKTSVRARWQSMLRNIMCMRIQMCQTILVTSPTFVLDIMVLKTYISRCSARINGQWANFWCSFAISPSLYHCFCSWMCEFTFYEASGELFLAPRNSRDCYSAMREKKFYNVAGIINTSEISINCFVSGFYWSNWMLIYCSNKHT